MDTAALDLELDRLRGLAERIGANLLELERSPTVAMIEAADLAPASAQAWAGARRELSELFDTYRRLKATLDRAVALRGDGRSIPRDRRAEIEALVIGQTVVTADVTRPIADRGLLDDSRVVRRTTLADLIADMASSFERINSTVTGIGHVWNVDAKRIGALRARLAAIGIAAEQLGEPMPDDLHGVDDELTRIARVALSDPVAFEAESLAEIEHRLGRVEGELTAATGVRDSWDDRIEAARTHLRLVAEARRDATEQAEMAAAKVVRTGDTIVVPDDDLAAALRGVVELAGHGAWRQASTELERWWTRSEAILERARASIAASGASLERRNELRGRLDAYQAKADRLACLEDPAVAAIYMRARDALYTAPADLDAAEGFVRDYQRALSVAETNRREDVR